jgi:hypothetical protein
MKRTTISLADETRTQVERYIEVNKRLYGRSLAVTSVVEECIRIAIPLLLERLPQEGESPHDAIKRRAQTIGRKFVSAELTETEILTLMSEAAKMHDECSALLLPQEAKSSTDLTKYKECVKEILFAYNLGAQRLTPDEVLSSDEVPSKVAR